MADEWIKIKVNLAHTEEVVNIAAALDMDEDAVVGKLCRLWSWADQHLTDDDHLSDAESNAGSVTTTVTEAFLDRYVGVPGFIRAMQSQGWLASKDGRIVFVDYCEHNGQTAKARALTAKRKRRHDAKKSNACTVTTALPEEEKNKKKNIGEAAHFDAFWSEWPKHTRKVNRAKCLELWQQRKLDTLAEKIIPAVRWFKTTRDWTKEDGQYIPAPLVWLNQSRWEAAEGAAPAHVSANGRISKVVMT